MKHKRRRYFFYYLMRIGAFLIRLLPMRLTVRLGRMAGAAGFYILSRDRGRACEHLAMAFPDRSPAEIRRIARNVFSNIAANFAELIHNDKFRKDNIDSWVTAHGMHYLRDALSKGKGAIVLTAHFGNWELVGAYMRMKGFPGSTIVRRIYFHKYDEFLKRLRAVHDVPSINRDESPKKMLRCLKENKILGMLADQDIDSIDGIFVNFFGKQAYTPVAPVKMAMVSGAPLVPCYMVRSGMRYEYFVDEPMYVPSSGDREKTVQEYTQRWTDVLESYIRRYPDQWVWMHRRWKTQPGMAR